MSETDSNVGYSRSSQDQGQTSRQAESNTFSKRKMKLEMGSYVSCNELGSYFKVKSSNEYQFWQHKATVASVWRTWSHSVQGQGRKISRFRPSQSILSSAERQHPQPEIVANWCKNCKHIFTHCQQLVEFCSRVKHHSTHLISQQLNFNQKCAKIHRFVKEWILFYFLSFMLGTGQTLSHFMLCQCPWKPECDR